MLQYILIKQNNYISRNYTQKNSFKALFPIYKSSALGLYSMEIIDFKMVRYFFYLQIFTGYQKSKIYTGWSVMRVTAGRSAISIKNCPEESHSFKRYRALKCVFKNFFKNQINQLFSINKKVDMLNFDESYRF